MITHHDALAVDDGEARDALADEEVERFFFFYELRRPRLRSENENKARPTNHRSLASLHRKKRKYRTFVDRRVRCDCEDAPGHDVRDGLVPRGLLLRRGREGRGAEERRKIELQAAAAAAAKQRRRSCTRQRRSKKRRRARRRPEG